MARHAEEQVHQHLKRRHAACILSLRDEFMRKRKKGKLPPEATTTLKTWWQTNVVWPYPTVRGVFDELRIGLAQIADVACAIGVSFRLRGAAG